MLWGRAVRLARSGTHLHHAIEPLEQRLTQALPAADSPGLKLPLHCVSCSASIERASAVWASLGTAGAGRARFVRVPGLLPPVEIDGEHYFDGGLVDSIPVGRAVALGRDDGVRSPGRPDRDAADRAQAALGGRPGRLRDRPAAPVPPGDVGAARRNHRARAAHRAESGRGRKKTRRYQAGGRTDARKIPAGARSVATALPGQDYGAGEHREACEASADYLAAVPNV